MRTRSPWYWVPSLYFAEGLPYVAVMILSLVMYKRMGISNTEVALYTSWLNLPGSSSLCGARLSTCSAPSGGGLSLPSCCWVPDWPALPSPSPPAISSRPHWRYSGS